MPTPVPCYYYLWSLIAPSIYRSPARQPEGHLEGVFLVPLGISPVKSNPRSYQGVARTEGLRCVRSMGGRFLVLEGAKGNQKSSLPFLSPVINSAVNIYSR